MIKKSKTALSLLLVAAMCLAGFVGMASGETWDQTTDADFLAGETTFAVVENDAITLVPGLNYQWSGLGEDGFDNYGSSVSNAGDVNGDGYDDIIIGAYYNDGILPDTGEVYVHFGSPDGLSAVPDWSAQGGDQGDYFGYSVSGAGDVNGDGFDDVIVGAYSNDSAGSDLGMAYLYLGSAGGLSTVPDWSDVGEADNDYYGYSVSGAGDIDGDGYDDIVVGAPYEDTVPSNGGKAYVYLGSASGPSLTPDWSDLGEAGSNYFGYSVSGAGDVNNDGYCDLLVGAYGNGGVGEAYVYFGSESGLSTTPDWSDLGEAGSDFFGNSVSDAGDVNGDGFDDILVGAYGNDGAGSGSGESYMYYGSESGPSAAPDWSVLGEVDGDSFGYSVSGAGDVNNDGYDDVLVGAYNNGDGGSGSGRAYVYLGAYGGPDSAHIWTEHGEVANDYFGWSVSGAGDVNGDGNHDILVGAYGNDDVANLAGKAYVYGLPTESSSQRILERWFDLAEAATDSYGRSVSDAGDVNGDGYDDILVGARENDEAGIDAGKAYVYFGSPIGPSPTPDWSDLGEATDDYYGYSVSGAGDVNGDGYDDVIVGAYANEGGGIDNGEAYVYYGSPSGPSATPDWTDQGDNFDDWFGYSVSGAGDVNGDGYDDVIVGACYNVEGTAYVYYGSSGGLSTTPDWSDQGEAPSDNFGHSVSGVGDVNGDGYDDVLVGAYGNDEGGMLAGKAYLYLGSASGLGPGPVWSDIGEASSDAFGSSVSIVGDVNGDGYDDIIIGAYGNDTMGSMAGKAYLYLGSPVGPSTIPDWTGLGKAENDYYGYSVSGAGDVDNDGYDDVIVGAQGNDDGGSNTGQVYVYYGSSGGPSETANWSKIGEYSDNWFGRSVSSAGDVNGDGVNGILVGAPRNGEVGFNAGKAYYYSKLATQYSQLGHFTSDTFSVEDSRHVEWKSLEWKPFLQPDDTLVRFQVATNDDGITWDFVGPDGTADTFFTNSNGQAIDGGQAGRFLKVRAYLETADRLVTPTIEDISVNYVSSQEAATPQVTITSPNGGEDWMKDDYYPITWIASGALDDDSVDIYWSPDNGESWNLIASGEANDGIYNWTVPNQETSDGIVRVVATDVYGNQGSDTSDASFAIDPPPVLVPSGEQEPDGEGQSTPVPQDRTGASDPLPVWLGLLNLMLIELLVIGLLLTRRRRE